MASTVNFSTMIFFTFLFCLTFVISIEFSLANKLKTTNAEILRIPNLRNVDKTHEELRAENKKRPRAYKPSEEDLALLSKLSAGNLEFTKNLYDIVRKEPGNIIMSPISVELALLLAYNGASGNTSKEIGKALGLPDDKQDSLKGAQVMMKFCKRAQNVALNIANGIFVHNDLNIKKEFIRSSKKYLSAKAKRVNFSKSSEAAKAINKFVDKHTNHKITELFASDAFDDMTKVVLVNAVYFFGSWEKPFNASDTYEGDFHLDESNVKKVKFMTRTMRLDYEENKELNVGFVKIPYAGHEVSMVVVLPKEINGLEDFENKIKDVDLEKFAKWPQSFRRREIILHMPKFKVEKTLELESVLRKLGMGGMLTFGKADFQEITNDESLYVSKVVHKAYIEVDEEGTKAAATTELEISSRMMPPPPVEVKINRPFFFYLYHHKSGSILFAGRVADI